MSDKKKAKKKTKDTPRGNDLAKRALDNPGEHSDIEKQLEELSPEEAEMFARALGLALRKRRWMLIGYFGALLAVVIGMAAALWIWATREPGEFVGWVFLLPPALAGAVIWLTGKYVKRIGT